MAGKRRIDYDAGITGSVAKLEVRNGILEFAHQRLEEWERRIPILAVVRWFCGQVVWWTPLDFLRTQLWLEITYAVLDGNRDVALAEVLGTDPEIPS